MSQPDAQSSRRKQAATKRFIAAGVIIVLAIGLAAVFPALSPHAFPTYRNVSKALMNALASACSVVPIALWDIVAACCAVAVIGALIVSIVRKTRISGWLSVVVLLLACGIFWVVGSWALNHYAPELSTEIDLDVREYTTDELDRATRYYLDETAKLSALVPRDESGSLEPQDFQELARIAGASYEPLSERYPVFTGCTLPVKELTLLGDALLYSSFNGIFMPLSGEASVPTRCAPQDLPFTMCHEASHRLGIAAEEEANFAAFLACASSDDARFTYAGYNRAFLYCYNALYRANLERARALFTEDTIDRYRLVLLDLADESAYYARYEGPASDAGQTVNDTYLRAFSEEEGVQSYGMVTDYLIAWYLDSPEHAATEGAE